MNKIITVDYDLIPNEKRCAGDCKQYLPANTDYFYPSLAQYDGLACRCKTCDKLRTKNNRKKAKLNKLK